MIATLQRFKESDTKELQVINAAIAPIDEIGYDLDDFFDGAFKSFGLGEVLYDLDRDPMSGVITRDTFRKSYWAIHNLFTKPGTFEYYLEVFRSIWGDSVEIEFEVPSPGILNINASVLDVEEFVLIAREIEDNAYVYSPIIEYGGDRLTVRDKTGIKSQSEIDALMNEITPNGIFVTTTLVL